MSERQKQLPAGSRFCLSVFCCHRRGHRGLFCDFNNVKYINPLRCFQEYSSLCTSLRYNQFHSRSFLPVLLVRPVGIGCVLYAPLLVSDAPPTIDTSIITDYIMTNLLCALPAGVHTAAVVSCLPVPATDLLWLGLLLVFKFYIIHNSTFTTDEKIVLP